MFVVASRSDQTARTRERLLETAERLFALHGIASVSSRQISKAAGQGNNYAVGHHFGDKTGLIRAILETHNARIDVIRGERLGDLAEATDVRDWIECLIRPEIEHLVSLGATSYYARFCAHMAADPQTGYLLYESVAVSHPLTEVMTGFYRVLPTIPKRVMDARVSMSQNMIIHSLADIERSIEESPTEASTIADRWSDHCDLLIDAAVGLWLAPTKNP
ncbi:TetR/AcrR family transcriptional regulator [Gordonia sp. SL306]|jgi:AcrR family transcriptional regulator|uniref:TetR/AcrR family transcriptional regulator n=1 Tax=Gordonia sp. SL306 TaxID=2995145 RepID=UPI0022722AF8|nr:TetR/AcrR family transcriptional regulator [Gordonia sp. SL306]WAC53524.1 helix-turn-helix domain containing protein [Gordonia sp. SL306]